jgi:segregation and condensation protein A
MTTPQSEPESTANAASDLAALDALGSGGPAVAGAYAVKVSVFEGPLDLLLHLIRQNDLEITDISIAQISRQYLDYLEVMRELNLDLAGDYLVMAATLALIKSRMLLPPDPSDEDVEELDPRAELVARLLDYQRFKEVAESLETRRLLGRDVFLAQGLEPKAPAESEREIEVGLFELVSAFKSILDAAKPEETVHEVEVEVITVRERMLVIMQCLEQAGSVEFQQIFEVEGGGRPTRGLFVASFLAMLELVRLSALRVYQALGDAGAPEGPIRLRAVTAEESGGWREQVSEWM